MRPGYEIAITATGVDELVVTLSGELDLLARAGVVDQVAGAIGEATSFERLVVELSGVAFCDSSGLGALLDIGRIADAAGAVVALRQVPPAVARLLDLAAVDDVLSRE